MYVFEADGTVYSYRDESKSSENVIVGTWTVTEPRISIQSEYVEGFAMDVTFTAFTMDGETQEVDNDRLMEIYPQANDRCRLENVSTGGGNDLVRVK